MVYYTRPPPDDRTILREISTLNTLIQFHAGNFYHNVEVTDNENGRQVVDTPSLRVIGVRRVVAREIIEYITTRDDAGRAHCFFSLFSSIEQTLTDAVTNILSRPVVLDCCPGGGVPLRIEVGIGCSGTRACDVVIGDSSLMPLFSVKSDGTGILGVG
ncbi:hypothetical protein K440DRAFT_641917 [Wilcoxina mikolae CBS 423.85]|nr:hypothetical protein K440DRAFT_641917 [Wilcoxina mikolae CBS 423.85]